MLLCGHCESGSGPGHGEVNTPGLSCPFSLLAGEGIGSFDECTKDLLKSEGKDSRIFVLGVFF